MQESDFKRIEEIAERAAGKAQHEVIIKTVAEVLAAYGIHSAEKMQRRMNFLDREMRDNQDMRRGFLAGIGGHIATLVISLTLAWGVVKGWFG